MQHMKKNYGLLYKIKSFMTYKNTEREKGYATTKKTYPYKDKLFAQWGDGTHQKSAYRRCLYGHWWKWVTWSPLSKRFGGFNGSSTSCLLDFCNSNSGFSDSNYYYSCNRWYNAQVSHRTTQLPFTFIWCGFIYDSGW